MKERSKNRRKDIKLNEGTCEGWEENKKEKKE